MPLDCSLRLPYLLAPVNGQREKATGREAIPPGLHGWAPAHPQGCRARTQVGRTKQQGAGGEGERRCSGRSGVTGAEQQGETRWGGAPTMAQPAGDGGGASWWSVEAGAERGGPAAARPGGGSQTGGIGIDRRCGNPARSRGSDGAAAWRTSCLLRSRTVVHRAATAQEERGPAQGRAHGGVDVEGATREPTRSHHHGR